MWCNLITVDEYFGLRGNTDWASISSDERSNLLQIATDRLEAIPFRGDAASRVTTRYNNASLSTTPPIPYNLLVAFCELSLWLHNNPLQQQQVVTPGNQHNISLWLSDLPMVIQNALSTYVDSAVGKNHISAKSGGIAYSSPTPTVARTTSGGGLSTVITQDPVIGSGTAADPVTLTTGTNIPTHYYQRLNINPTITGSSRIQDLALVTGTDNPTITSETYRIPIMPKTNATGGVRLNREFETNFYGTMLYKVDRQVGVNFFSEVIHHNSDVNAGPDFSIYRRVIRPSVLNEASTLSLSEFDSAVQLAQGDETVVVPISINLVVQASDIQNAAVAPTSGLGTRISDIRFVKAAVRFKQDNDIIGMQGPAGTGGGTGLTPAQSAAIAANTAKVGITTQQAADISNNNAKIGLGIFNVGNTNIANDAITSNKIANDAVGANELGTVNNGTQGQFLRHGGADVIEWATIAAAINGVKTLSLSGTTLTVTNDDDTSYTIILPTSGGGGGGLSAVASDTSLTGDGTNTSPLGLAQTVINLIAANTAKVGISTFEKSQIVANSLKRSYPQADENKLGTIAEGAQVNVPPAAGSIGNTQIAENAVTFDKLDTTNFGTSGQVLTRNGIASMGWSTPTTGGGGLTTVSSDDTLTGNGTNSSLLGVASGGINATRLADDAVSKPKIATTNTGTTGQVLTLTAGVNQMEWATPTSGGGGSGFTTATLTTNATGGTQIIFSGAGVTPQTVNIPTSNQEFASVSFSGSTLTLTRQDGTTVNTTITTNQAAVTTINGLTIPAFPT